MSFVLLDRDGTIIVEKHYLSRVEDVEFLPGAVGGLRLMRALGFQLIVITNQSGIGRGLIRVDQVEAIHSEIARRLRLEGVEITAFYFCPHGPSDSCGCRKPATELGERAAADFGFRLSDAIVIGDKASDVEFGRRCGALRTIQVLTGYGREQAVGLADFTVEDLAEAASKLKIDKRD